MPFLLTFGGSGNPKVFAVLANVLSHGPYLHPGLKEKGNARPPSKVKGGIATIKHHNKPMM